MPGNDRSAATDVVVVGAGAAGLAAARRLLGAKRSVVVVEACDRIGGRAYTESHTFGFPFDHGCAWLQGPPGLPHVGLAEATGFTLVDASEPDGLLFTPDGPAGAAEGDAYDAAAARITAALGAAKEDVAADTCVDLADPWAAAAATWVGAMDHGVDFADLSTGDFGVYGPYAVNALIREGLGALVLRSAEGLPVRTGTTVTGIDWSGPGVTVHTTRGDLRARACIVTVSTGVLASGRIRFTPSLPLATQAAVDDLPMGLLVKIALATGGTRFGLADSTYLTRAITEPLPAPACFFFAFPAGWDLIVGFVGGSFGWELARAGEAAAIEFALGELTGMLGGDVRRHVVQGCMTCWADDPLTLGAYAAARPGRHAARAVLAQPLGERVFFAGEALGGAYPALMSGAHLSGEAAADAVLGHLGRPAI